MKCTHCTSPRDSKTSSYCRSCRAAYAQALRFSRRPTTITSLHKPFSGTCPHCGYSKPRGITPSLSPLAKHFLNIILSKKSP